MYCLGERSKPWAGVRRKRCKHAFQKSSSKFVKGGLQFLLGMIFASLLGANNAFGENFPCFGNAIADGEHAPVLVVGSNVFRVAGDQLFEVSFRRGGIPFFHAFHREAVTAKSIERIFLDESLEHLPAFCACLGRAHMWRIITARMASANSK